MLKDKTEKKMLNLALFFHGYVAIIDLSSLIYFVLNKQDLFFQDQQSIY